MRLADIDLPALPELLSLNRSSASIATCHGAIGRHRRPCVNWDGVERTARQHKADDLSNCARLTDRKFTAWL